MKEDKSTEFEMEHTKVWHLNHAMHTFDVTESQLADEALMKVKPDEEPLERAGPANIANVGLKVDTEDGVEMAMN